MQYSAHGALKAVRLGNLLWEHTTFNARLQPEQIGLGTQTSNSSVLQLDYTYGGVSTNNGNVMTQIITIGAGTPTPTAISQSYTYDQVNRLKTFTETGGWSQTYNYDEAGNRWVSPGTSNVPNPLQTPQSPQSFVAATNRINGSVMNGFAYDAAGNQTSIPNAVSGTDVVAYDAENRQTSYARGGGQTTSYTYDGDGRRVKKTIGTATTVFVYNAAGQLMAEYDSASGAPLSVTKYITADHLGSTRVVTGQTQSVVARYDYLPFGEQMGAGVGARTIAMGYGATDGTRQKFTQKERDSESGLDYFGARYYASTQGRFTTPDDFFNDTHQKDPQSWNLYAYVGNDPLRFIDPKGTIKKDADGNVIFDKTGEGTVTFIKDQALLDRDGSPTGKTMTIKWAVDIGNVYAGDGTKIETTKVTGDMQVTVKDSEGKVLTAEGTEGQKQFKDNGYSNVADCHGTTLRKGRCGSITTKLRK